MGLLGLLLIVSSVSLGQGSRAPLPGTNSSPLPDPGKFFRETAPPPDPAKPPSSNSASKGADHQRPAAAVAEPQFASGRVDYSDALLAACIDPSKTAENQKIREACAQLNEVVFSHATAIYRYDIDIFQWQLSSQKLLFWIVMLLVLSGVVFAGVQFFRALRTLPLAPTRTAVSGESGESKSTPESLLATNIDLSASGLKVSSSVLGVIVLVISMGFLYLYLTIAYPITPVPSGNSAAASAQKQ